ncbi:MAG: ABC transporter permease [Pseudomonadota bacterium]
MRWGRAFVNEAGAEVLKAWRAPEFLLPTMLMPVAFFTLFAVVVPGSSDSPAYLLATFGVFAVMGPAIFGFGVAVANERERGWLDIKRASPASGGLYIAAKLFATVFFGALSLALIYGVAAFVAGVSLPTGTWFAMMLVHLAGSVPFALIGLTLGFLLSANGAVAVSNIVFLALSALGGLWIPVFVFPIAMQRFATLLPSYHLSELALAIGVGGDRPSGLHAGVIAIMTAVLAALAAFAWKRQRG